MTKPMWKIAAEKGGRLFDLFKEEGLVAMGLEDVGDISLLTARKQVAAKVQEAFPKWPPGRLAAWAGMLFRFQHKIGLDDYVITYDPGRTFPAPEEVEAESASGLAAIEEESLELIKDRVATLDWDELQELVAGLLRAMGYKTRVSPLGPDRGKDIGASPDGFGLESPRIVVEVKHRAQAMGAQEIRSFLGGRHVADKGLYVSTGGFTKDAYYEAERANIPLTLMSLEELVQALLDHYDHLDIETQQLIPLKKIYWPV